MARVRFDYLNHRNEVETREVEPVTLDYDFMAHEEYGHKPGWFLHAKDYTRGRDGVPRSFALERIIVPFNEKMFRIVL